MYNNIPQVYKNYSSVNEEEEEKKRSMLDRVLSLFSNESITSAIYNATDSDPNTGILEGIGAGVKKMNPFEDDTSDSHTFSDVLTDNLNWNPDGVVGKVAKGVVGLAGDILLDPLTFITAPISATAKVVKGTGAAADAVKVSSDVSKILKKGNKAADTVNNIKNLKMMDIREARKIIGTEWASKGKFNTFEPDINSAVSLDTQIYNSIEKEAQELLKGYNKKVLGIIDKETIAKETGISAGFDGIPFASKIKIGDRQLNSFRKNLVSSEKLRKLGDDTVAPYYNKLLQDIRNSKVGKKFDKFAEIRDENIKNGTYASGLLYEFEKVGKYALANKNAETGLYKTYSEIEDALSNMDETKRLTLLNSIENGDMKDALKLRDIRRRIRMADAKNKGDYELLDNLKQEDSLFKEYHDAIDRRERYKLSYVEEDMLDRYQRKLDDLQTGIKLNKEGNLSVEELDGMERDFSSFAAEMYKRMSKNKAENKVFNIFESVKRTDEDVASLKNLTDDDEMTSFGEMWIERMREIAEREIASGELSEDIAKLRADTYVPHIMTKEAQNAIYGELSPEDLPKGFNQDYAKKTNRFGKQRRTEMNINEFNEYMKEPSLDGSVNYETGELFDKFFEDSFSEIYLTRALTSNKILSSKANMRFLKENILKEKSDILHNKHVVEYNDLMDNVNDIIGKACGIAEVNITSSEFQKIKNALFKSYGVEISSNLPLIELKDKNLRLFNDLNSKIFRDSVGQNVIDTMIDMNIIRSGRPEYRVKFKDEDVLGSFYTDDNVLKTTNVLSFVQRQEQTKDFVALYDALTNKFKKYKTLWNPGFIPQNAVGNTFNSWLANAETINNPSVMKKAFDIIRTKDPKAVLKFGKEKTTYENIYKTAKDYGVVNNTFTSELSTDEDVISKIVKDAYNKVTGNISDVDEVKATSTKQKLEKKIENKIIDASSDVENTSRLALFINEVNSGKNFEEAAESVKKFLFEYDELTDFERNVMKRVIPFYTWMKKNSALQLEQLLEQSHKFALIDKTLNSADEALGGDDEKDLWDESNKLSIGGKYSFTPNLPIGQFDKVDSIGDILNQVNPMIKLPAQAVTGKNFLNGGSVDIPKEVFNTTTPQVLTDLVNVNSNDENEAVDKLMILLGKWSGNSAQVI